MRVLNYLSKSPAVISLLLLVFGAAVFHVSLYSLTLDHPLPLVSLLTGILLQALALTSFVGWLLKREPGRDSGFCLVFLAILSLSMAMTRLSRFAGFSGFDFLREVQVMHNTARTGYWDPSLTSISNYQSSLAITILPTVASRILGIPPDSALLFQTFTLMALLPLTVQAVVSSLTTSFRIGTLSGVLLAANWFFFGAHVIGKTAPALFLATVALYCLVRREARLNLAGALLGLCVAMSHYTVALVFNFTVLALVVSSLLIVPMLKRMKWFKQLGTPTLNPAYSLVAIMLVVVWLGLTTSVITAASTSAAQVFTAIVTLASGPKREDTSLAVSNTAGPIITVWFNFQNFLIGIGGLFWLNMYRKSAIQGGLANWLLAGLASICLLLAWIVLPFLSVSVESTRVLAIILPVVIVFSAVILIEVLGARETTQGNPEFFLSLNPENRTHDLVYSSPKFWIVIPNPP